MGAVTDSDRERWAAEGRPPARDRLKSKQSIERIVNVYLEPELATSLNEALIAVEAAKLQGESDEVLQALQDAADAATVALDEQTVKLHIRAIGRKRYDALVDEHPPTDEQNADALADHGVRASYNGDTFPPALIHASLQPFHGDEFTEEDVREWFDSWNGAEILELFAAALEVNTQRRVAGLGNG